MNARCFRNSALHADYYRRIGINYVMALPLRIDNTNVISVVFNRSHRDFSDGERGVLDAVRQPLAAIYRNLVVCEEASIGLKRISQLAAGGAWEMMRVTMVGPYPRRFAGGAPTVEPVLSRIRVRVGRQAAGDAVRVVCSQSQWGLERPAINHGQHFTLSRLGSRLTVHFVPDPDDAAAGFLLMKGERLDLRRPISRNCP